MTKSKLYTLCAIVIIASIAVVLLVGWLWYGAELNSIKPIMYEGTYKNGVWVDYTPKSSPESLYDGLENKYMFISFNPVNTVYTKYSFFPFVMDAEARYNLMRSLVGWRFLVEINFKRKYDKVLEYNYDWQNTKETGLVYRLYGKGQLPDGTTDDFDYVLRMEHYDWIDDKRAEGDAAITEAYEKYKKDYIFSGGVDGYNLVIRPNQA